MNLLAMLPAGLALGLRPGTEARQRTPVDWLGLGLLAFFMVMLISGLHALSTADSAPWNPILLCVPSQKGLFTDPPQRHKEIPGLPVKSNLLPSAA